MNIIPIVDQIFSIIFQEKMLAIVEGRLERQTTWQW